MPKQKRAPVEKWKLTPELIEIEKAYRKRNQLTSILKRGIVAESTKLNTMVNVFQATEKQKNLLRSMVPAERQEIEGTPLPDADFSINY